MLDLSYWDKRDAKAERAYREYGWRLYHEWRRESDERRAAERALDEMWLRRSHERWRAFEQAHRGDPDLWGLGSNRGGVKPKMPRGSRSRRYGRK
jgi:hypothetical protein